MKRRKLRKWVTNIPYVIIGIILLWVVASYFNTIAHNVTDYTYAWWNCFRIISTLL